MIVPTQAHDSFDPLCIEVAASMPADPFTPTTPATVPAVDIALTSTIIGPQRRVAQINGKMYCVGQGIEVIKGREAARVVFKLVEVQPRRAVLEGSGQRFELLIPEPGKQ
jgi:hypothetical protein